MDNDRCFHIDLAFDEHDPVVEFDQGLCQGQAEARALVTPGQAATRSASLTFSTPSLAASILSLTAPSMESWMVSGSMLKFSTIC
jgi:hypothetical protein